MKEEGKINREDEFVIFGDFLKMVKNKRVFLM